MTKLFKKAFVLLTFSTLIGQTMLMNVTGAIDDVDLNPNQEILESNSDNVLLNEATPTKDAPAKDVSANTENSQQDSGDNNGDESSTTTNSESKECSSETISNFMDSLAELINDRIENSDNTGFIRAEVSDSNTTLILYIENENVVIPDLNGYITGLVDHILGKETENTEKTFRDTLALKNRGLSLNVTDVMGLVDINLGQTTKIYAHFNDCSFPITIELKVDDSNEGGNDNNQCSNEIKSNFINSLSEAINNIIKSSNSTGFKRTEASTNNDTIILYIADENVKLPNLTRYINSLTNYILGKDGIGVEDIFRKDLASKNEGLSLTVTSVMNLVNLEIGERNYVVVNFRDCNFPLNIELKIDKSDSNGNSGNGYSGGGGGGSSNGGGSSLSSSSDHSNSSNDEELVLSGEVTDDEIKIKKAESCSIEGSTFSEEENQAYLWACEKGIVIADNIMKANLRKNLTRAELAKMLSVYSEELLGRTRVKNESVTYPDISDKLGDLAYYIQEGYKLQIMGIHADGTALSKFSPSSSVTRGEFGTVFSRVLHGNKYNIGNSHYYEKHLEVLKDEGILTNTNPKLIEKRGWILLMLYRSQKVEASNGNISNEEIANITANEEKIGN